jgi:hypothetical protein
MPVKSRRERRRTPNGTCHVSAHFAVRVSKAARCDRSDTSNLPRLEQASYKFGSRAVLDVLVALSLPACMQ